MNPAQGEWAALSAAFPALKSNPGEAVLAAAWAQRHGDFDALLATVAALPVGKEIQLNLPAPAVGPPVLPSEAAQLRSHLQALAPWRKGPFALFGVDLDAEWRSDFKMARMLDLGLDFSGKKILDVGCGNGYFLLRMLGCKAELVVGIDPSWPYFAQFLALKRMFALTRAFFLPTTLEALPLSGFELVLSMGVLYHRRDPLAHLGTLREALRPGGQLLVETLCLDGDARTVWVPEKTYAGMRNVWFLPSRAALLHWLKRLGFAIVAASEPVPTTFAEQRRTAWMTRHSLADFLSADGKTTREGEPPPQRVAVLVEKK